MGLLDGGIQAEFGAAFGAVYLDARHYRRKQTAADNGDITGTVEKVQSVKACRDTTSDRMRADLGFTDKDARLFVLQAYNGRAVDAPGKEDRIRLEGVDWIVGDVDEDVARSHWIIRAARAS